MDKQEKDGLKMALIFIGVGIAAIVILHLIH